MPKERIIIGVPSYGGGSINAMSISDAMIHRGSKEIHYQEFTGSLLTFGFNLLWAAALNLKEQARLTHFLLLHADIRPLDKHWLNAMIAEMDATGADVLSAISPIKDQRGLTSTALDTDFWRPCRISLKQAVEEFPESWTRGDLLVNTGLMLVDFRKPWVEDICFTMRDRIIKSNGQWQAEIEPEDWNFSRQCHALGARVVATRKVVISHQSGPVSFRNDKAWGQDHDFENILPVDFRVEDAKQALLHAV